MGTAVLLGLSKAKLFEKPTTAHFLLGDRCVNDCAFCAQAKNSRSLPNYLSRVAWPKFVWEEIEEPLTRCLGDKVFLRVCVQTVECSEGTGSALAFIRKVRSVSRDAEISACITPYSMSRVEAFFRAGASRVGLPVDAVTPSIFRRVKKGSADAAWAVLCEASRKFLGKVSTHFIAGLGETQEEMVGAIVKAKENGVTVAMFSFTPVRGTEMEKALPPQLSYYRRIQLAAHFLKRGGNARDIRFSNGEIVGIAFADPRFRQEIRQGRPFMTSGCLGCNRPYYNERPGQDMLNYPRALSADEAVRALEESGLVLGHWGLESEGGRSR